MGNQKIYTPKKLDREVRRYFKSISREVTVTEKKATGEKDKMGHMIFEDVPVINSLGKEMKIIEYLIPPSVDDLADFLQIHRSTWTEGYCKDPDYSDTTMYARGRMRAYLVRESMTRSGKDLKGILFNLENNYGYSEKVSMTTDTMEDFLRRQNEETMGGQEF